VRHSKTSSAKLHIAYDTALFGTLTMRVPTPEVYSQ
jgi:hypothetical protein